MVSFLFRGSVTLSTSASGQTSYVEPEPAIHLNNAIAALKSQEKDLENAILTQITSKVVISS